MMVEASGLRMLLTGDLEPESQRAILATGADLRADVLKVPHHGSSKQEQAFIAATDARLALISVGIDNDYGHPAPRTLELLAREGMTVARTDTAGSIAIVRTGDRLALATRGSPAAAMMPARQLSVGHGMLASVMAARKNSAPKLGDVLLVTGSETFLADRAVRSAIAAVSQGAAEVEVTEHRRRGPRRRRVRRADRPVLVRRRASAGTARCWRTCRRRWSRISSTTRVATSDDVLVVLVHSGGQKGKAVLDKLRKASVNEVVATAPKTWELPQFVVGEIRLLGGGIDERAAAALVDAVGHDLRALAGACSQLVSDSGGKPITPDLISQYFGGRAEVTSFAVADAAIAGRTEPALEQLRWALDCGVAAVLVTSAMAGGLRGLAKYTSAPSGLREADLAREVGVPPWKLKTLKQQARGWTAGGLATAIKAVAQADADVKGASGDAGYALERMVITVSRAHGRR